MDDDRNRPPERPNTQDDGMRPETDQPAPGEDPQLDYEPNRTRSPFDLEGANPTMMQRVGWLAAGIFLHVVGVLIVFLMYRKRDPMLFWAALRYVLIGVGIGMIIDVLLMQSLMRDVAVTATDTGPGSPGWTSTNF